MCFCVSGVYETKKENLKTAHVTGARLSLSATEIKVSRPKIKKRYCEETMKDCYYVAQK